jgi:Tol biopolymer transport system component
MMSLHPKTALRVCRLFAGLLVSFAVVGGCVRPIDRDAPVAGPRTHALLAAAEVNQVSMFGDLPGQREGTYFSRTALSLKQHTFTEVGADFDPDIDPTGERIVFASTRHNLQPDLYIKTVDGVAVTQLTSDPASDIQPAYSPDGKRVAFASNRGGNWDIWVVNVDGGPPVQVTQGMADEVHPSWSPDGSKLVFCSLPSEGGQWELWIADATAGSTKRFIGYGLFPEWSPAGDTILFQRARERGSHWFSIWSLTLVDGEPRYPTELAAGPAQAMILPTWSPDGLRVVFSGTPATPSEQHDQSPSSAPAIVDIWLVAADGSGMARLTDGHTANHAPVFAPDGRIFFTSNRSGHDNIWSLLPGGPPIEQGDKHQLTRDVPRGDARTEGAPRTVSAADGL